MDENNDTFNPQADDVLGVTPGWITNWGITVLFLVLILAFGLAYFIKYPEVINTTVTITSLNPPVPLVANADGNLNYLLAENNKEVKQLEVVAVIENTAEYSEVRSLSLELEQLKSEDDFKNSDLLFKSKYSSLGELQEAYNNVAKSIIDYKNFLKVRFYEKKVARLRSQLIILKQSHLSLSEQKNILEKEYKIASKQYHRDSTLFADSVLSPSAYEKSEKAFLQDRYKFEISKSNLINLSMQEEQIIASIQELEDQFYQIHSEHLQNISSTLNSLRSQIAKWEEKYVIRSPTRGEIVLNKFWTNLQYVRAGEKVLTIIPNTSDSLIGRVQLPVKNSGKVHDGQPVNIKLDNYPHIEFGMVKGEISRISTVPDNNFYTVEVTLPDKLKTTYGKQLDFNEELIGQADIITEDISLLQRLFYKTLSLTKNS